MKKQLLKLTFLACFLMIIGIVNAQSIADFRVKNAYNESDRTMMLDILRANLYQTHKQEFIFQVNHFKVGGGYAWFMGNAERRDGRPVRAGEDDDCCHVEALFSKRGNKWYIEAASSFSTDVWWVGISYKYPRAPRAIFDETGLMRNY
jgi:hypothetical protein